jgi:hypothetical protein
MKATKMFIAMAMVCTSSIFAQEVYTTTTGKVSFFSKTAVEDIDGTSKMTATVVNLKTKQIFFKIQNTSFKFREKLMEEHFNENYMESDKYPISDFNGKIVGNDDFTKIGEYKVTILGILNIHGKKKEYKVLGKLINNGKTMLLNSNFKVKLADHGVEIPTIVFAKIAEVIDVKVIADCKPFVKA